MKLSKEEIDKLGLGKVNAMKNAIDDPENKALTHPYYDEFNAACRIKLRIVDEAKIQILWKNLLKGYNAQGLRVIEAKHNADTIVDYLTIINNNTIFIDWVNDICNICRDALTVEAGKQLALWTGGYDVSKLAQSLGFCTLETTLLGGIMNTLRVTADWNQEEALWNILSKKFVQIYQGVVHIYFRNVDELCVLFQQEIPMLKIKTPPIGVVWHPLVNTHTADEQVAGGYKDNEFILLDDLVYAPLHALAKSNQQLRAQVVDAIKIMGTMRQNGQEKTIHLNNINVAYEQVRPEGEEGYSVDNLQVQVPLLSIVPITNLNVEKAEIDFATEVKAETGDAGQCRITARICAPEQRESDFLPRVSYKMQITSLPATEGILRLTDILSANQISKKIDTTPVVIDGNLGSDEQKNTWHEVSKMKAKVKKLKQLHQKISDMIAEQERLYQIRYDAFEEGAYEFDKDKYLMAQSNITNRIMGYQEKIINKEIKFGLDKDYE